MLILMVFALTVQLVKHGERRPDYNAIYSLIDTVLMALLLYWGGFWTPFLK